MLWIKAFHIMAVIAWMAGLFYLPRLFVYHCQAETGSKQSETFKIMERRLLKVIMAPASILTWVLGLVLAYMQYFWFEPWFIAKFVLVSLMTYYHHLLVRWARDFSHDDNQKSEKFFRLANEVPTVLMALIVILVIVKPF